MPASSSTTSDAVQRSFIIAWLCCVLFYVLQYALRSMPSVMMPELQRSLSVDAPAIGSMLALYFYTYALFSIISGAALDRYGGKLVIPCAVATVALGSALFGLGSLHTAQAGRLLQGAGSAVAFTGAVYLAVRGLPARYLATAVGVTQSCGMLGGAAGQFAIGPLIHGVLTWQQVCFWLAAGLVVLSVALLVITPGTPPSSGTATSGAATSGLRSALQPYRAVLSNPQSYLCGAIAGLLFLPTTLGVQTWAVPFLEAREHVSHGDAVDRAAIVSVGWAIGCPLFGYLADRLGQRKPALIGGAVLLLVAMAAAVYLPVEQRPHWFGLVLGIASGAAMIPYAIIKEVNPDNVKGSATGAINFLVFSLSAIVASLTTDALTKSTGPAAGLFEAGWGLVASVALAIALAFFLRETGWAAAGQNPRRA